MVAEASVDPTPALVIQNLSKAFQGQWALRDVSLSLRPGEVHCLLGQNGSGKSTLIKILAGYHDPEPGATAEVNGRTLDLGSPVSAHDVGLQFIHQDLALIDGLSVIDNLALGQRYESRLWLTERAEKREAERVFESYGVHNIDVSQKIVALGAAQRTMVAIVRALHHGDAANGVLVLDEPTASLADEDKSHLFRLIRELVAAGGTVMYVTHRLQEVFEIADRVTILRDGRKIATVDVAGLTHDSLVELIVGRTLDTLFPDIPAPGTKPLLEVTALRGGALQDLSVTVHEREIVGVVGLTGSGVDDVPHLIFGVRTRDRGRIIVAGKEVSATSPWHSVRAGIAFVPGDRKRLGGVPTWSLAENLTLPQVPRRGPLRWLSERREAKDSRPYLSQFNVVPEEPSARFSALSGGNQQKVMIARWIRCQSQVLLLEEPTAGVDVGAKVAIYDALAEVAESGRAVLITTSDLEEACAVCDRVLVLRDGRVGAVLAGSQLTVDNLLREALREEAHV